MSIYELSPDNPVPISANCPVCGEPIPVVVIEARRARRGLYLAVQSYAYEWVLHMWSHDVDSRQT